MGIQAASEVQVRPELPGFQLTSSASVPSVSVAIPELQPLRAIGCLTVFGVHAVTTFFPRILPAPAERSAFDYLPHAVVAFFIASGLVLALPFVGQDARPFSAFTYYYQRFFRLYPLFWISVSFTLALRFVAIHWIGLPSASSWPQRIWSTPITPRLLLIQFAGLSDTARSINPAYWTLALEIQACLIFPLVILFVRRTRHWVVAVLSIVAIIVATHYLSNLHLVRTLSYFVMGAYVAKYNQPIKGWLQGSHPILPWAFLGFVATLLWNAPRSAVLFRISFPVFNISLALLMVAVQTYRPLVQLARWAPLQRMADISYSFYLFHFAVLAICFVVVEPHVHSPLLSSLLALSVSILVAWVGWRFVEIPVRRWAKRIGKTYRTHGVEDLLGSEQAAHL